MCVAQYQDRWGSWRDGLLNTAHLKFPKWKDRGTKHNCSSWKSEGLRGNFLPPQATDWPHHFPAVREREKKFSLILRKLPSPSPSQFWSRQRQTIPEQSKWQQLSDQSIIVRILSSASLFTHSLFRLSKRPSTRIHILYVDHPTACVKIWKEKEAKEYLSINMVIHIQIKK